MRTALIGCGKIGSRYDDGRSPQPPYSHAGGITQHPFFDLVAAADPDPAQLRACQQKWNIPQVFGSYEELLATTPIDVLVLATPPRVRLAPIRAALAQGVRLIICEKPLALTLAEAQAIVAACGQTPLVVNFSRRWDSAAQEAAQYIATWGKVEAVHGFYNHGFANNAAHLLDLLNWWAGGVAAVEGVAGGADPESPGVSLRLLDGGEARLTPIPRYDVFELDVFCERGRLRLQNGGAEMGIQTVRPYDPLVGRAVLGALQPLTSGIEQTIPRLYDNVAAYLMDDVPLKCVAADGLAVTRILDAVFSVQP